MPEDWYEEGKCMICGEVSSVFCDVCDASLCAEHAHRVGEDTDVCSVHDDPENIKQAIERRGSLGSGLDYETSYGHCLAKNPYWFIPDIECNTDEELLSWRHALFAVKQGTFTCPEHFFWKDIDAALESEEMAELLDECGGILSMMKSDDGKVIIHGHNTTWGMGISAFSDKINVWEQHPRDKWILELAESDIPDSGYLSKVKEVASRR